MTDLGLVRENYARMSDDQLLHLARHKGVGITTEALEILHDEFNIRGLDTSVFESINTQKDAAQQQAETAAVPGIWTYVWEEKRNGKSDTELIQELKAKGVEEERCRVVLANVRARVQELHDTYASGMMPAVLFVSSGLLLRLLLMPLLWAAAVLM